MKLQKFSITDNTTFYGKDTTDFYSEALLGFETAKYFRPFVGVKSKAKIPSYNVGNIIQAESCTWSNSGEGTLAQKSVEVCDLQIMLELCQTTFEQNFLSEYMRAGSNTGEVTPELFKTYMINQVKKQVMDSLEQAVWLSGATYPNNVCQSIVTEMLADSTVIDVASATTITISNVVSEMNRLYDAIPSEILNNPELVIFVSTKVYKLYLQALAAASNEAYYSANRQSDLTFLGIPVINLPGMGTQNLMVAGVKSNFLIVTDLMSDMETLAVIPQFATSGVPTIRISGLFKFLPTYLVGAEIVLYKG